MKLTRARLLLALFTLTPLSLCVAGLSWAQGTDTPIIIADGSLTIESRGVPWTQYGGTGGTRSHPDANKTVTAVDLTVNGSTQTIAFTGQRCIVTAQYGNTTITISSGANGKGLQVSTDFNSFHGGASSNHLAHNDGNNRMGAITVRKGTASAFSGTGNGHSAITIHYR